MQNSISRIMVELAVSKALKEIKHKSKRELRNLVDLGMHYATGRFQDDFFFIAQHMLSDPDSPYYDMVFLLANGVDETILKTVGMNIGYHSWTVGASAIRAYEKANGYNVPWTIVMDLATSVKAPLTQQELSNFILQARTLNIYCYMFFVGANMTKYANLFDVFQAYADCAFVLFVEPEMIDSDLCASVSQCKNVIPVIALKEENQPAWKSASAMMAERHCLFGYYVYYDDSNLERIVQAYHTDPENAICAFAFLIENAACSPEAAERMHAFVMESRTFPTRPMFPIDFYPDIAHVDRVISTQDCFVKVLHDGGFCTDHMSAPRANIRHASLQSLLAQWMPKVSYMS